LRGEMAGGVRVVPGGESVRQVNRRILEEAHESMVGKGEES